MDRVRLIRDVWDARSDADLEPLREALTPGVSFAGDRVSELKGCAERAAALAHAQPD